MWRKTKNILLIILFPFLLITISVFFMEVGRGRTYDRFKEEIENLEKKLENPYLSDQVRNDLLSKLEGIRAEATQRESGHMISTLKASGKFTPAPKTYRAIPTEGPATLWKPPDGISDNPIIPNPIFGYSKSTKIISSWRNTTFNGYYLVYTGFLLDDPEQGIVLLLWQEKLPAPLFKHYLTPKKSGAVKVVEEHGSYIVLQAENGDLFYFDPVGERFIDSLDAPTVTLAPGNELENVNLRTPSPLPYP